jgi:hypothetical protein
MQENEIDVEGEKVSYLNEKQKAMKIIWKYIKENHVENILITFIIVIGSTRKRESGKKLFRNFIHSRTKWVSENNNTLVLWLRARQNLFCLILHTYVVSDRAIITISIIVAALLRFRESFFLPSVASFLTLPHKH